MVVYLLSALFSINLSAADYNASCQDTGGGLYCTVALESCSQATQSLADEICQNKGFLAGKLDPYNFLIGEDNYKCGIDAVGPYTYVGCVGSP